jgi:hypothetical protein
MNCLKCKYKNIIPGGVNCDRRKLIDGVLSFIPESKIFEDCPCHSDLLQEETRTNFSSLNRWESDDCCPICHRLVKNSNDFTIIKTKDGTKVKACKICVEKGEIK